MVPVVLLLLFVPWVVTVESIGTVNSANATTNFTAETRAPMLTSDDIFQTCTSTCTNSTCNVMAEASDAAARCSLLQCMRNCTGLSLHEVQERCEHRRQTVPDHSATSAFDRWASCPASSYRNLEAAYIEHMRSRNCDEGNHTNYTITFQMHAEVKSTQQHESIFFLFLALLLGVATLRGISRHCPSLPYSSVLLVEGMLLVVLDREAGHRKLGALSRSIAAWHDIDAHMIMFGFLPALLFGDTIHLNAHVLSRCLIQCVILAVPGVLVSTALTAYVSHVLVPYWGMPLCFAFGTIASATDPVAVVALLKDLGASPVLTMQITGESLFNDGTAIVLFSLFFEGVMDPSYSYSAKTVFLQLARVAFGGPTLGWLLGRLLVRLLQHTDEKTADHDELLQLMLTLGFAYLIFFIAENEYHVSGVLATVVAGTIVARDARPSFVSHKAMEGFWHAIEYAANTLVFMLAGVLLGKFLYSDTIQFLHWVNLFGLYFFANLIRLVVIGVCYPALRRVGYSTNVEQALFMVWGGLRGAVGLSLALFAKQKLEQHCVCYPSDQACLPDPNFIPFGKPKQDMEELVFYAGGLAMLSLTINGTFAGHVLRYLGLTKASHAREVMRSKATDRIRERTRANIRQYKAAGKFELASEHLGPKVEQRVRDMLTSLSHPYTNSVAEHAASVSVDSGDNDETMLQVFLEIVKNRYWKQLQRRELTHKSRGESQLLMHSVDMALDKVIAIEVSAKDHPSSPVRPQLWDWDVMQKHWPLATTPYERMLGGFYKVADFLTWGCFSRAEGALWKLCGGCARDAATRTHTEGENAYDRYVNRKTQSAYIMLTAFVSAHEKAQERLILFYSDTETLPEVESGARGDLGVNSDGGGTSHERLGSTSSWKELSVAEVSETGGVSPSLSSRRGSGRQPLRHSGDSGGAGSSTGKSSACDAVIATSRRHVAAARRALEQLEQDGDVVVDTVAVALASALLEEERCFIEELRDGSLLTEQDAAEQMEKVGTQEKDVHQVELHASFRRGHSFRSRQKQLLLGERLSPGTRQASFGSPSTTGRTSATAADFRSPSGKSFSVTNPVARRTAKLI